MKYSFYQLFVPRRFYTDWTHSGQNARLYAPAEARDLRPGRRAVSTSQFSNPFSISLGGICDFLRPVAKSSMSFEPERRKSRKSMLLYLQVSHRLSRIK